MPARTPTATTLVAVCAAAGCLAATPALADAGPPRGGSAWTSRTEGGGSPPWDGMYITRKGKEVVVSYVVSLEGYCAAVRLQGRTGVGKRYGYGTPTRTRLTFRKTGKRLRITTRESGSSYTVTWRRTGVQRAKRLLKKGRSVSVNLRTDHKGCLNDPDRPT